MDRVEVLEKELEFLDVKASVLRRSIEAAQRELARVVRRKKQLRAELSRLRHKTRRVMAV